MAFCLYSHIQHTITWVYSFSVHVQSVTIQCMNRKSKYIAILSLLFFAVSALASVELEIEEDHDDVMRAVQQGLVQPFSSLQSKVDEQLHGRIIRVELEEDDDIWIYELKLIDPNNNIVRVEYDAKTLTILEIKGRGLENIIKVDQ
ncbi:hypothetical protein H744_1c1012 [Photobacterium gaetbulicola Gung47]|uniref:PepSY domain-containing protein n=2 Tax=Vibrionaceae TaxID=641 RepID=A0A0C5WIP3_9GAMM|nr:hypothetical protein H744_1c1012 [Photobacterium gaetbulicola Gung47]